MAKYELSNEHVQTLMMALARVEILEARLRKKRGRRTDEDSFLIKLHEAKTALSGGVIVSNIPADARRNLAKLERRAGPNQ